MLTIVQITAQSLSACVCLRGWLINSSTELICNFCFVVTKQLIVKDFATHGSAESKPKLFLALVVVFRSVYKHKFALALCSARSSSVN